MAQCGQLDYDTYLNPDVESHIDGFELQSEFEYKELLKNTGFFIQERQRSLFSEFVKKKKNKP